MKIKLIGTESNLSINNLLLRYLLLDSYATDMLLLVGIMVMKKNLYLTVEGSVSIVRGIIIVALIVSTIISKTGKGIHDLLGKTMCIEEE